MATPGRDEIQLPTDGTGKQLDAYAYAVYDQTTGTTSQTRYAQVLVPVDPQGNPLVVTSRFGYSELGVKDKTVRQLLEQVLLELRQISIQLGTLTDVPALGNLGDGV